VGNQVTAKMFINQSMPNCVPIVTWWCWTKNLGANHRMDATSSYDQRGLDTSMLIIPYKLYSCTILILLCTYQAPLVKSGCRVLNLKVQSDLYQNQCMQTSIEEIEGAIAENIMCQTRNKHQKHI
jgi:hypothetical protein